MYDYFLKELERQKKPIDLIVVGLGFMGYGFLSFLQTIKGVRISLLVTRRPNTVTKFLAKEGYKTAVPKNAKEISAFNNEGFLCVSDQLSLVAEFKNKIVVEMTGTIDYGAEVSLKALNAGKHLITMNPELQNTLGSQLKKIADTKKALITDVVGDQPGSLARMISEARLMGFKVIIAGNMKRYLDRYATQKIMAPWAKEKGLSVRQTTSFTDGTKQSIEMSLLANYFDLGILEPGMKGPRIRNISEALSSFNEKNIVSNGVVDYVIGRKLFPGIFLIVEHKDNKQRKYLKYLGLGNGPRYVLFEPYHLCHLEIINTIAKVYFFGTETINNGASPLTKTVAVAKSKLKKGHVLDGIGGDTVYGQIQYSRSSKEYLQVGLSQNAILKRDIQKDEIVKISDVNLPVNTATKLAGY